MMLYDELKYENLGDMMPFYPRSTLVIRKQFVDAAIDELKREHHKERHEYIDMVAQLKAKLVEQESENRRLKRALYKACANWADVVAFEETDGIGHDNSVAERWRKMESKCLKKAKEYL